MYSLQIAGNGLAMKRGKFAACFFVPGQKSLGRVAHVSPEYGLPCFMSRC